MSTVEQSIPPLVAGDKLTTKQFLERWEVMPYIKFAELIGGVVYMPSPLSHEHGVMDRNVSLWLGMYGIHTPGCEIGGNATCVMTEEDTPQPDVYLRVLAEYGGQTKVEGLYLSGPPELVAEICLSSTSYDLNQKLELYEQGGVPEYVTVLLREQEVRWHRLIDGQYQLVPPASAGVVRSHIFPGLWLDRAALLAGDMAKVLATLNEGLASAEHQAFVERLAARKAAGAG